MIQSQLQSQGQRQMLFVCGQPLVARATDEINWRGKQPKMLCEPQYRLSLAVRSI
jgi:hypothetical protein